MRERNPSARAISGRKTFSFLGAVIKSCLEPSSEQPAMSKPIPLPARNGRILLADDEDTVRRAIRLVLAFSGYEVVEARDGQEAVERYLEASPPFDLIVLDLDMPRLNGTEALACIRRHHPQVKVILLSGGAQASGEDRVFLQKPFDNQELVGLIRQTIGGQP